MSDIGIKQQLDDHILPLVAGAGSEQEAEALARNFGITGVEFEVLKSKSGLSSPALLFASVLSSLPLFVFSTVYIAIIPIAIAMGWIVFRGTPDRQKSWNALHGVSFQNNELKSAFSALQAARKAILMGDLSPVIIHELTTPLDKLEDNLEMQTLSGKLPDKLAFDELISAAQEIESSALAHQDIDRDAALDASKSAEC